MKPATIFVLIALISMNMNIASQSNSKTKPGACPKVPTQSIATCDERCSGDDEVCPGKMKCCSNGSGHSCRPPVF
uniref:WAP domain-containing protein n=1 Tax=Rattus norvegicus TaxID=10116 RepID=A0A0G2K2L4_RAT